MNLFIDPNVRGCGIALFDGKKLVRAKYVAHPDYAGRNYLSETLLAQEVFKQTFDTVGPRSGLYKLTLVVIERPVIYPGMPDKDLNDLIDVAAVGSAVNNALYLNATAFQTVKPAEWKGNVPKKVMLERIRSKLTDDEMARCEWTNKSDNEDLLDAVGMGLWHAGRLNSKKYPGAT